MKIVHVVECFSGGTVQFVNQATNLISDCQHFVIHGERSEEISAETVKSAFSSSVSFIKWHSVQRELNFVKDLKALLELYKILKDVNADVVHLHSSKAGFLGRIACKALNFKAVIYTPHGAAFLRKDISKTKVWFFEALEKIAASITGSVVCCSRSEADAFGRAGIKASYINNGIDISVSSFSEAQQKPSLTIVTCGRITDQKNPALFNQIATSFNSSSEVKFIWIGEGEKKQLLSSKNIAVTGWLPKEGVLSVLKHADIYLSTALWEGLPFAVLEAMSLGKVMLLKNCVGNIDLVNNNFNGFSFDEANEAVEKINWFLNNRKALKEMGLHSKIWCEREFNINDTFKKYSEQYRVMASLNKLN